MPDDHDTPERKPHTAGPWKTSLDADQPIDPHPTPPREPGVFEGTLKWVILIALFFGLAMLLTVILRSTGGRPTGF
jgi:hypothetical protein